MGKRIASACGTAANYRRGCRCGSCRQAMSVKQREYREAMIAKYGHIPSQKSRRRKTYSETRNCTACGGSFTTQKSGPQRFCSLSCAARYTQNRPPRGQIVLYVGQAVEPKRKLRSQAGTSNLRFRSGQCRVCSAWFVSVNLDVTCSAVCAKEWRSEQFSHYRHRRRALERAAYVEDVSRKQVFERDGYRCYLCGKMTRPDKQTPHPKAPTIDHVIPLAVGGTHEPLNCRTACFRCNCRKSHRGGGEQLLLIA